jgi:enoyl-CoA hydratase/carnithine racemase
MNETYDSPLAQRLGPIVWVTLSRPEKANALDRVTVRQLLRILERAEQDEHARALILTGAGRNFCAGADLAELIAGGSNKLRSLMEQLRTFLIGLERSRLITIAAVHGAARAGGLELALACDIVLATRSSTFGDAHLANGLLPAGGSTARLPRVVGWQRAKWLILSGESIEAYTARDWGLVLDVIEDSDLRRAAQRVAEKLMRADALSLQRVKGLLAMVSEQPLSTSLEAEIATLQQHYHSDAFQLGIKRFLSRRKGAMPRSTLA